ncbi:MAG: hypothetical protein IH585_20615 [Anaerolineaceae bacterium]|nr:hypothetical protein [Anaerolineaceae bacterium]
MKKIRFGINPLALFAGISLIISMFFPWWTLEVSVMNRPTDIYPYIIDGPASEFIGYKRSPQMEILFYLLLTCIVLLLIGSFIKGKGFAITLTVAGVLVGLAIWRFLDRIAGVARIYEVPIQGHGVGSYGGFALVDVYTLIQPGLYLAIAAALLGILSGIFHNKLTNKFSLNWI